MSVDTDLLYTHSLPRLLVDQEAAMVGIVEIIAITLFIWTVILAFIIGRNVMRMESLRVKLDHLQQQVKRELVLNQCEQMTNQVRAKVKRSVSESRVRGK